MKISANEIAEINEAGELNGAPVKMLRMKGGFWVAVGTPAGKASEEALAAGSHPAIVKYAIEKKYPAFHPSLEKSETFQDNLKVMQHSHFLTEDLRKSGYDIHSLESSTGVDFVVSQHGITKSTIKALFKGEELEFVKVEGMSTLSMVNAVSSAISEKALTSKFGKLTFKGFVK